MAAKKVECIEKKDRYALAKEVDDLLGKQKLKGKNLTMEQRLRVVLTVYSNLRKKLEK